MPLGLRPARIRLLHTMMIGVTRTVGASHTTNAGRRATLVTTKAVTVAMVPASIMVRCRAIRSGPFAPPRRRVRRSAMPSAPPDGPQDEHRDPVRIAAAQQENAERDHDAGGDGHHARADPVQRPWAAAPIRGIAPTRKGKIEAQNGDEEQEGVRPDDRQRERREEDHHHGPEKDPAAVHVLAVRAVEDLRQRRHRAGGQRGEAGEDVDDEE